MNTTSAHPDIEHLAEAIPPQLLLELTELDEHLYRRAAKRLDARIKAIANFDERLQAFSHRCAQLRESPVRVEIKPPQKWTRLPVPDL